MRNIFTWLIVAALALVALDLKPAQAGFCVSTCTRNGDCVVTCA